MSHFAVQYDLRLGLSLTSAPSRASMMCLGNTLGQQRGWWLQNLTASVAGLMAYKEANIMRGAQSFRRAPQVQLGSCMTLQGCACSHMHTACAHAPAKSASACKA